MSFTQPLCLTCWHTPPDWTPESLLAVLKEHADADPIQVTGVGIETCCLCGRRSDHGIYVRVDPRSVPYPR